MPVDFIGMIGTQPSSEIHPPSGPIIDKSYVRSFARAHEAAGFDRVLIGYYSTMPDGFLVASFAAHETERLGLLLAHRPGFVQPTVAARKLATLDQFSDGRLAVHIISGGDDADQRRDGDYLDHDERYARTGEYLSVMKRVWSSDKPFDHVGPYYKFEGNFAAVKPVNNGRIPIYFGGSSPAAIEVAGREADVFALWGESLAQVRETVARVRAAAARHGRSISFSLSLRPILAPTEAEAWARAERILERAKELQGRFGFFPRRDAPTNAGSLRLLETAAEGAVVDKRLWTEIAALTKASGNSTALVGTPDQVAESLLAYYDIGITTFLIRGFDPLEDATDYGRELIPLVRQEIARRDAELARKAG